MKLTGRLGWLAARAVHWIQIPGASRRMRVLADWVLAGEASIHSASMPDDMATNAPALTTPKLGSSSRDTT
jgi:hypothetical protein